MKMIIDYIVKYAINRYLVIQRNSTGRYELWKKADTGYKTHTFICESDNLEMLIKEATERINV